MSITARNPAAIPPADQPIGPRTAGRTIPAWLFSSILHLLAVLALALLVRVSPRVASVEPDRSGGIVLVEHRKGKVEYLSESDPDETAAASASAAAPQALSAAIPDRSHVPVDLKGFRPSQIRVSGSGTNLRDVLPDATGLLDGVAATRSLGGKTTTQVFGAQGTGSKFVYVFDRSGSMSAEKGRPLKAAKTQLIESLKSLKSTDQFQIIFYNEQPLAFNPYPGKAATLMFGTDDNKELARRFIERISASGSTQHIPALRIALNMTPDVVFFLTDAEEPRITAGELEQIRRWNKVTSINSIEFGTRPYPQRGNFLFKLADQNNGHYVYRNVTSLKAVE